MNQYAHSPHIRRICILLAFILLLSALPILANATDTADSNGIHLTMTGDFEGRVDLFSDDTVLFDLKNIGPGDSWTGKIRVTNSAKSPMSIRLVSIVSNLKDMTLFDAMVLDVSKDGRSLYSGGFGSATVSYISVGPSKTIDLDVTVTLPRDVNNSVSGKDMDATWTFEARYTDGYIPDSPETGDQSNILLAAAVFMMSVMGIVVLFLWNRKKEKEEEMKEQEDS